MPISIQDLNCKFKNIYKKMCLLYSRDQKGCLALGNLHLPLLKYYFFLKMCLICKHIIEMGVNETCQIVHT